MPSDIGVDAGASRPPMRSAFGTTENITVSWWPWYEPSIFTMSSRPVAARATRIALIVASVPEFAKRTCSSWNRRHSSSANSTVSSVGAAKCVPVCAARVDRLGDLRVRVADDHAAEAAVGVDVLVAVDVPDVRAAALAQVDRVGVAGLERRADAERQAVQRAFEQRVRRRRGVEEAPCLGVGDLGGA